MNSPRERIKTATVIRPRPGFARQAPVTVKRPRQGTIHRTAFPMLVAASAEAFVTIRPVVRSEPAQEYRETTQVNSFCGSYRETSQSNPVVRPSHLPVSDPVWHRELTQDIHQIHVIRPRVGRGKYSVSQAIRTCNFRSNRGKTKKSQGTVSFESRGGEEW